MINKATMSICMLISHWSLHASGTSQLSPSKRLSPTTYVIDGSRPLSPEESMQKVKDTKRPPLAIPQELYDALKQAYQEGAQEPKSLCLEALIKLMPNYKAQIYVVKNLDAFTDYKKNNPLDSKRL